MWLSASNLYFTVFFGAHVLFYTSIFLIISGCITLFFMLYNYYCPYGYCWYCCYYTLFLFQISGDVGEQVLFDFCAEGFILPRTSPTIGRSLPVGSHLVVIQWGSCSWPFCSNKCAIFIMQRFERLFLFILYSAKGKWHAVHVDGCLEKSSILLRSTKRNS